ncbi:hypothetical protein [Candidatus Magnetobacterium casense]|uniref:Uncharacterized protein n=1 Tax=Candidatus Magnetobacterium casense TaxID=1455061 RepID=A0ABS6RUR2_9BACT|nr:hypothetical protein [Candidatus Magnetobacterium casensis]MBV6340364.1 hypothetical protein [Candidatus Magnetobacterium casensis]
MNRRDTLVEQVIRRSVTIANGAEGVVSISIPTDVNVFLKGVGWDYYGSATYKLLDSHRQLHSGSNQLGSVGLPQQWSIPFYVRGTLSLYITNNTGASQDYTAVFILHTDSLLDIASQGGACALSTMPASGVVTDVQLYGFAGTTSTSLKCDSSGYLMVALTTTPTIDIGDVAVMGVVSGTDTKVGAVTISSVTSLNVNIQAEGGAAMSATNPLWTELTDGSAAISSSNPLDVQITDGTTGATITAGLTALKVDLVGEGGAAIAAANPVFTELTDGTNAISATNPLPTRNIATGTLLCGTAATTSDTAVALGSTTACRKLTIQADYANTTLMYVGNATSQLMVLYAGDSIDIEVDDISKVYIKRTTGGANVTANYVGG